MGDFAQRFIQIPAVIGCVFSFLSIHLAAELPRRLWKHVGSHILNLVVDTYDTAERRFWCGLTGLAFADALALGRLLTQLRSIVFIYPRNSRVNPRKPFPDFPDRRRGYWATRGNWWGFISPLSHAHDEPFHKAVLSAGTDIIAVLVEGHCEEQRAAAVAPGPPARGTLESIEFIKGGRTLVIEEDEYDELTSIRRQAAADGLPAPLDPPPSLDALSTIKGIGHHDFYRHDRHWQLPSLRCLKDLRCTPNSLAGSLARISVAEAGQAGPLAQLEDIGVLDMRDPRNGDDGILAYGKWKEGLDGLKTVLDDRGCHSLKNVSVRFESMSFDTDFLAALSAIETFKQTVCVCAADIPVHIKIPVFDLSVLCDVGLSTRPEPEPSPAVERRIQQMAADTPWAAFFVAPHHLTTPLDTPSPAASTRFFYYSRLGEPWAHAIATLDFSGLSKCAQKDAARGIVPLIGAAAGSQLRAYFDAIHLTGPPGTLARACGHVLWQEFKGWSDIEAGGKVFPIAGAYYDTPLDPCMTPARSPAGLDPRMPMGLLQHILRHPTMSAKQHFWLSWFSQRSWLWKSFDRDEALAASLDYVDMPYREWKYGIKTYDIETKESMAPRISSMPFLWPSFDPKKQRLIFQRKTLLPTPSTANMALPRRANSGCT